MGSMHIPYHKSTCSLWIKPDGSASMSRMALTTTSVSYHILRMMNIGFYVNSYELRHIADGEGSDLYGGSRNPCP